MPNSESRPRAENFQVTQETRRKGTAVSKINFSRRLQQNYVTRADQKIKTQSSQRKEKLNQRTVTAPGACTIKTK